MYKATIDELRYGQMKNGDGFFRFNIYVAEFEGEDDASQKVKNEWFIVGARLVYGLIKLPEFGDRFRFPTVYLSSVIGEKVYDAVVEGLPIMLTLLPESEQKQKDTPKALRLVPKEIAVPEMQVPLKNYQKIFPQVSEWREYKRV